MSSSAPTGAQTAVVTGAGGFLGSHLAAQLLEAGWSVRAAVRDPADAARLGPLVALAAALPGSLTLHRADLLAPGSFDDVVAGADVVFHAASPFAFAVPDDEVLRPAVEGTRNVMAACAKAAAAAAASAAADGAAAAARPRLRVVLTSSAAAVKGKAPRPPVNGVAYTEEVRAGKAHKKMGCAPHRPKQDWNDTSTVEGGEAYWVSKTTAERLAWDAARAAGLDLVTICPEFIIGAPFVVCSIFANNLFHTSLCVPTPQARRCTRAPRAAPCRWATSPAGCGVRRAARG